ncbi:rna-directed dna polymerase from mobile element jockey-like [Willisornis vidua]|uniref:Rna-directed dna polymerase from mobile element jockey-like n=1 Tax=Willisornis vidua TaxID=1566151 RepID=A0ABQ9DAE4_9PASS|nr:rna-directed dna polymerase from mobile element jockey-like [Willisornis vidua]
MPWTMWMVEASAEPVKNLINIDKAKWEVLQLVQGNTQYRSRLGDEGIQSSPAEKDMGVLLDERLDMIWQCALTAQKAKCVLGYIQSSLASRSGGNSAPLLRSGESPPGVLNPALGFPAEEGRGPLGVGPEEATKTIRGMEHLFCEQA